MIRFACKKCGYKIRVRDENAGKSGKCPKCTHVFIVPKRSNTIEFQCSNCGQKISVLRKDSGKKGTCPNCKNAITIPGAPKSEIIQKRDESEDTSLRLLGQDAGLVLMDVKKDFQFQEQPVSRPQIEENHIEQKYEEEILSEDSKSDGTRKFPWFIDIFLYPVSISGLTHLAIFTGVFVLISGIRTSMRVTGRLITLPGILIGLYMAWYFAECVRESANGNNRAPEAFALASLGEMWDQMQNILGPYLLFITPSLLFYPLFLHRQDAIYWALLITGAFFFPMSLLACIMFDSAKGLNPILLIASIFSTFLQYCLLVLFLVGIVLASTKLTSMFELEDTYSYSLSKLILGGIFFFFTLYITFVIAHLIGRFYWRNEEKLNWEC